MYKPLQKKNSSWTPTTVQKKSKSPSKLGHFSIQPKPNKKSSQSSQSPEIGEYSRDSADRLAANVMRSLEAKGSQEAETPTVQPQSESRISVADVVGQRMPTVMPLPLTPQVRMTSEVVPENPIQRQCADCASEQQEQSAEAGKEVEQISLAASGIQAKVTVGAPGDKYEVEADTVARQVMSMPAPVNNQPIQREAVAKENVEEVQAKPIATSITPLVQREMAIEDEKQEEVQAKTTSDGGFETSSNVETQLNTSKGGGSPLSHEVRSFMEPRFGADFSSVRAHTDSAAVQMSQELGAQAFTHGSDVYFGKGKSPGNNELTAHELTHVVQQGGANGSSNTIQKSPDTIQRDPDDEEKASYTVEVPKGIKTLEELHRYAEVLIFGRVMNKKWKLVSGSGEVKEGKEFQYIFSAAFISAHGGKKEGEALKPQSSNSAYKQTQGKEREEINQEIDKRYWEEADIAEGEKIKKGEQAKIDMWNVYRDQVMNEHQYIKNLPPQVKKLIKISTKGKEITPEDYAQVYRIGKKIEAMEPSEVLDYYSKISGSTTDLNTFESALDKYIQQQEQRAKEAEKREEIQTKLSGHEDVYQAYKEWKKLKNTTIPSHDEFGVRDPNAELLRKSTEEAERKLLALLEQSGFSSIAEFEKYISDFEVAFQKESVNIALDFLSKYEGLLYKEGERYKDPQVIESLHQQLGGFRNQYQVFQENAAISNEYARNSQRSRLPGNGHLRPKISQEEATEAYERAKAAKEAAQSEIQGLSGENPLLKEDHLPLDQRLDKEKMAQANPSELGKLIQKHIADQIKNIHEAKAHILDDPEIVFKLDKLMPEFYGRMEMVKGGVTDRIIKDKISEIETQETIINIVLAVVAIALAIISWGTATPLIAAGSAGLGFGLSAYMAFDEYQKYIVQNDLADVGFADDPSMFWLIVAVAGATLDMGAAAKAVKALAPAAKALNAGGDVAEFSKALKVLQESGEIEAKIAAAAEKAALAKQGFKEASSNLFKVLSSKAYGFPGPFTDPDVYRELVRMAAAKIKQGAATFEQFLQELRQARKLAKLGDMEAEELAKAKEAWEQAQKIAKSADEPVDIVNSKSGKVFGRYSQGNYLEVKSKSTKLYGGNSIKLDPEKTTTLTGTLDDVNSVASRGFEMPGSTLQGSNPGGINILRSPKWKAIQDKHIAILKSGDELGYWKTVTDEFWETVNKPWLDEAIARGDNFRFVSDPSDDLAIFTTKRGTTEFILDADGNKIKSIFGREIDYLRSKGYTFLADGTAVKAP